MNVPKKLIERRAERMRQSVAYRHLIAECDAEIAVLDFCIAAIEAEQLPTERRGADRPEGGEEFSYMRREAPKFEAGEGVTAPGATSGSQNEA